MPTPLYNPASVEPAYQLRYSWTAWPSSQFDCCPLELITEVEPLWESDGLHLLEQRWTHDALQILFSARPNLSPQFLAARAKGRLDHAARQARLKLDFSRKLAVRSIGDNTRADIEAYIANQVAKESFIDPRFEAVLEQFTVADPSVDLSRPTETARGRYWYNLHLVLVVDGRCRIGDANVLARLRDGALKIATKKGHRISRFSVMPDHLHAALRPTPDESPTDVVFAYQNNLAYLLNMGRFGGSRSTWARSANTRPTPSTVWRRNSKGSYSPSGQAGWGLVYFGGRTPASMPSCSPSGQGGWGPSDPIRLVRMVKEIGVLDGPAATATRPHPACLDGEGDWRARRPAAAATRPHPACLDGEGDGVLDDPAATATRPHPARPDGEGDGVLEDPDATVTRPHPACPDGEGDWRARCGGGSGGGVAPRRPCGALVRRVRR